MAESDWKRAGAVALSGVAFSWVVVQAQGGCEAEPASPAADAAATPKTDVGGAAGPSELAPPAEPVRGTPTAQSSDSAEPQVPRAYFPASKSGAVGLDAADLARTGNGSTDVPKPSGKKTDADSAGPETTPKAFFPASKSGRIGKLRPQAPNAPAAK
ncbi:MAG: hypothetical protein KUG77_20285 [Nannocystaceae bacterium]|nr:hypothetical protein [Nannocystaceae bacterium]